MLFILFLYSLLHPAYAGIYLEYDLSKFTEGTCTPVQVKSPVVASRMVVATAASKRKIYQDQLAFRQVNTNLMEVCWPDEVGRGRAPTFIYVYSTFQPGGFQITWEVPPKWKEGKVEIRTDDGPVVITIGTSRAITPPN